MIIEMQLKNIFFDFDGVLLDTVEAKGRAIAKHFEPYGADVYQKVYQYHLNHGGMNRKLKIQECYKSFLGKNITDLELHKVLAAVGSEMRVELYKCKPVKGVLEFMKLQKESSCRAWVVSAAPEEELLPLAQHFGFSEYVEGIYGYPNKKSEVIATLIQRYSLSPGECLMIGDAQEDYLAAESNNIKFLLRKTTYSSFAKKYSGTFIVDFCDTKDAIHSL